MYKKNYTPWPDGIYSRYVWWLNIQKPISVTHCIKRLEKKSYIIIPINTEKAFYKIQHPFIMNTLDGINRGRLSEIVKNI